MLSFSRRNRGEASSPRGGCRVAIAVSACGGGSKSSSSTTAAKPAANAKSGGTLTLLSNGDVDDALDPGYSYYQFDFMLDNALHRPLFRYKPTDTTTPSPDLAAGPARRLERRQDRHLKIKKGIKFSPPVNREVTSADVKYAIERDFLPQVGKRLRQRLLGRHHRLKDYAAGKAKEITGIETPDKQTIVHHISTGRRPRS